MIKGTRRVCLNEVKWALISKYVGRMNDTSRNHVKQGHRQLAQTGFILFSAPRSIYFNVSFLSFYLSSSETHFSLPTLPLRLPSLSISLSYSSSLANRE